MAGCIAVRAVSIIALAACGTDGGAADLPRWSLEPDLRIGEVDGPNALGNVVGIEVGPGGEVYVVEWRSGAVRVFGADGRFTHHIGRSGDGPGEFTYNPGSLWVAGDTLIAGDPLASRFHIFRTDGSLVETVPIRPPAGEAPGNFAPRALVRDGAVIGSYATAIRPAMPPVPVVRFGLGGGGLDTLFTVSLENTGLLVMLEGGGFATSQPLDDGTLWDVTRDRAGIVVVDRKAATGADDARFHVLRHDLSGDTTLIQAIPYTPIALNEAMRDSIVGATMEGREHDDRFAAGALRAAIRDALYLPAHLPPVTALVLGRDGTMWLRREEVAETVDWLVLDAQARPVARVATPAGLAIHRTDRHHVWGVVKDELDVEYVVRYTVRR